MLAGEGEPIRRHQTYAPAPTASDSRPPTATVIGIPATDASAPAAMPPIGIDAEKTVV